MSQEALEAAATGLPRDRDALSGRAAAIQRRRLERKAPSGGRLDVGGQRGVEVTGEASRPVRSQPAPARRRWGGNDDIKVF